MTYTDVMEMQTNKRRFFIGMHVSKGEQAKEAKATKQTGKGQRTTRVSGAALKSKLRSGEIT